LTNIVQCATIEPQMLKVVYDIAVTVHPILFVFVLLFPCRAGTRQAGKQAILEFFNRSKCESLAGYVFRVNLGVAPIRPGMQSVHTSYVRN
jgi:hypothetical protein